MTLRQYSPLVLLVCAFGPHHAWGCSFANSNMPMPNDAIHRRLSGAGGDNGQGVAPDTVDMGKNAFVTNDVLLPQDFTGTTPVLDVLIDYAAKSPAKEDLCYWSFQGLPAPARRVGPDYWDVSHGEFDQDIEWVQAYGEVAVSRLHSMVKPNGSVVGAVCSMGWEIMQRRCATGRANGTACVDAITKAAPEKIRHPMAISIFKVGPELRDVITQWRGKLHAPNINWVMGGGSKPTEPWNNGSGIAKGDVNPTGMPQGPNWPVSQHPGWGSPKIAKVVPCSKIPERFNYSPKVYTCDSMSAGAEITDGNDAYTVWKSLTSVWPPTTACVDDVVALNVGLKKLSPLIPDMPDCKSAIELLGQYVLNFGCNSVLPPMPLIKDVCCSQCFNEPIPHVAPPSPSPPAPAEYKCAVCMHVYDPVKDGNGKPFEELPDTWTCPVCKAPKSAYRKTAAGEWAHEETDVVLTV